MDACVAYEESFVLFYYVFCDAEMSLAMQNE